MEFKFGLLLKQNKISRKFYRGTMSPPRIYSTSVIIIFGFANIQVADFQRSFFILKVQNHCLFSLSNSIIHWIYASWVFKKLFISFYQFLKPKNLKINEEVAKCFEYSNLFKSAENFPSWTLEICKLLQIPCRLCRNNVDSVNINWNHYSTMNSSCPVMSM